MREYKKECPNAAIQPGCGTGGKDMHTAMLREQHGERIQRLAEEFRDCQKILQALGDENRQHLILEMMQMGSCGGARVGAITARTNLSRPAVSHHIRILKEAGLLKVRREGTKNYYYFDKDTQALRQVQEMLDDARAVLEHLP